MTENRRPPFVSTAVRFRPSVHERLKQEADERMVSVSFLVNAAVEKLLDELPETTP